MGPASRHLTDGLAELGVAGKGLFPVPSGHGVVAERSFGVAQSAMGVRLLVGVADLAGQREGIVVPGAGLGWVADGEEDLAEQIERFGEQGELSGLVADEHGPFHVLPGVLASIGPELELAQVDQGARLAVAMAVRAEQGIIVNGQFRQFPGFVEIHTPGQRSQTAVANRGTTRQNTGGGHLFRNVSAQQRQVKIEALSLCFKPVRAYRY